MTKLYNYTTKIQILSSNKMSFCTYTVMLDTDSWIDNIGTIILKVGLVWLSCDLL